MSKPTDNIDTSAGITQEDITDVVLTTFEVVQEGPPIKRMKLDDTVWTSTELLLQPETSNGSVLDVQNVAGSSLFNVNTSTPLTRSDAPVVIDVTNTEALLVRKDADAEDIFVVDTSTPVVRSDAPTIIDMNSTTAFQVRQGVGITSTLSVDTTNHETSINGTLNFTSTSVKTMSTITMNSSPLWTLDLYFQALDDTIFVTWSTTAYTGTGAMNSASPNSTIPSAFRPAATVYFPCRFTNNGTAQTWYLTLASTGYVTIGSVTGANAVSNTGNLNGGGGVYKL